MTAVVTMSDNAVANSPPTEPADAPTYRVSHLTDDVVAAFAAALGDSGVQDLAPFDRGGLKPRVNNRVQFTASTGGDTDAAAIQRVLDTAGFEWTTGEPGEYVILGRRVNAVSELRKGDRLHINKRRGPYRVYRVYDHAPETIQKSSPAITAELTNEDTDTDWLLVHWKQSSNTWAYVKTTDASVKAGYRFRKVKQAEWLGRIGPARALAPVFPDGVSPGKNWGELTEFVSENLKDTELNYREVDIKPTDTTRVSRWIGERPPAEVFSADRATLIREVLTALGESLEANAGGLEIESEQDKSRVARYQALAARAHDYADGFELARMDVVTTEDTTIHTCEDCGQQFTDKYKYPTHRRDCYRRADKTDD